MNPLVSDLIHLLAGILCAWLGGELFVRGLVGFGLWARIPGAVVGVTVAALATSSPEISVAIKSSLQGVPAISMGDVLGSNVANIALVLAIALLIAPHRASLPLVRRDLICAAATPVVIGVLAMDGHLSRTDGAILLVVFLTWLTTVVLVAIRNRNRTAKEPSRPLGSIVLLCAGGMVFLIGAGHFIVVGAKGLALACGLSEFVVGATIVAVATSTPEMATTLIAKAKGHNELGLGNILGSNIFNGLFIVSLLALLSPFSVEFSSVRFTLVVGLVVTVLCTPLRDRISRGQGVLLLLIYLGYNTWLILDQPS